MTGSQVCPQCGQDAGSNDAACDGCRMYLAGRSDARLYPMLFIVACWAFVPLALALVLWLVGDDSSILAGRLRARNPGVSLSVNIPGEACAGDWFEASVSAVNTGTGGFGVLWLSFPGLTRPGDGASLRLKGCSASDLPGPRLLSPQTMVRTRDGQLKQSGCWRIEYTDFHWKSLETNTIEVRLRAGGPGSDFPVRAGAALSRARGRWYEPDATLPVPDSLGWLYRERTVRITVPGPRKGTK